MGTHETFHGMLMFHGVSHGVPHGISPMEHSMGRNPPRVIPRWICWVPHGVYHGVPLGMCRRLFHGNTTRLCHGVSRGIGHGVCHDRVHGINSPMGYSMVYTTIFQGVLHGISYGPNAPMGYSMARLMVCPMSNFLVYPMGYPVGQMLPWSIP